MKKILVGVLVGTLFLNGCASHGVSKVDPSAVNYELNYQIGTIESIRPVVIKDNGTGSFIGTITGGVLGSLIGRGRGSVLATLLGGLSGAYAGKQVGQANALELGVVLEDGRRVVVIAKGKDFHNGEKVRIVKHNGRVYSVEEF